MNKAYLKSWATPLAASSFIILAVTGILMFFKIETGLIKPFHEWLSWAMVAGVILHTIANWKQFTGYFSRKPALAIIGIGVIVTLFSVFTPTKQEQNPRMKMTRAIISSKLETVAELAGSNGADMSAKLQQKGIAVSDGNMTIRQIAASNGKNEMAVLAVIFQ
ncbi:MAG: DUF4405 domain-containing protein [Chlorobiaceae bacterium]|nr:DUF4405 domain-containing protein [Chlorobiaceae bacterium]NTV61053.1 DUF4405 domain-containing protein [Chlorobiaceae bacterium]